MEVICYSNRIPFLAAQWHIGYHRSKRRGYQPRAASFGTICRVLTYVTRTALNKDTYIKE